MTILKNDPITSLAFSIHENPGVFAVLLGSGLSRSAGIPTGWEITLDLIRRIATIQGIEDHPDWAEWYHERTGQGVNYSLLLQEIAKSPDERRAILNRYIEPDEQDREKGLKLPTKAHHAIAHLVRTGRIRVIITTNFDRLMENALREQNIEPTVVASEDALIGAEPLTHSRCYVLKLHGDYKDTRILNTDQELSIYPESYNKLLDRIFDEHGLIVCGWSGNWDRALEKAFLRAPNRRYPVYWATREELSDPAKKLVDHKAATLVPITDADDFFQKLQQQVEILDKIQPQNPLSVELLVSNAKRYLARPEHRIQLDELFTQQTELLFGKLDDSIFSSQVRYSQELFRTMVKRYESLVEPLARMSGVLGRWGDDKELDVVLNVLQSLYHDAEKIRSGSTYILNLRTYPAVLVFTAYGIGLTKAKRWTTLLNFFSTILTSEHHEPKQIVSTLFLRSWEGGENKVWRQLEGLENRTTPLSDHLFEVMGDWKKGFTGTDANFQLLFDRFELLASLAVFALENDENLLNKFTRISGSHFSSLERDDIAQLRAILQDVGIEPPWMPIGRAGWRYHPSAYGGALKELENNTYTEKLLEADFANGDQRVLRSFIYCFKLHTLSMW